MKRKQESMIYIPDESRPRSWLCMRWMLSLAAISLPFSTPAFERREPLDWGAILEADENFSIITEDFSVSSTIPLYVKIIKYTHTHSYEQFLPDRDLYLTLIKKYIPTTLYHHTNKEWKCK